MPGASNNNNIELKSDLEAQKANLLSRQERDDSDDGLSIGGSTRSSLSGHEPKPTTLPDGAVKSNPQKSSQTSFLIWTTVNTLATIGIVNHPALLGLAIVIALFWLSDVTALTL